MKVQRLITEGESEVPEFKATFGKVKGGVMTVRFTFREGRIRIIGAGYWRKGKKIYDKENHIHG